VYLYPAWIWPMEQRKWRTLGIRESERNCMAKV